MIKVGIVGFGLSGRYLQAPFFLTHPQFKLEKIVTSREVPAEVFPEVKRVDSINDLLKDSSLDLISICSPNATHFTYAKQALEAGKHVLIEKPVTPRVKEAEVLFDLANKLGKVLCVFQNRRFDSDFMTVEKVIKSGLLGEILSYEAHFDRYRPSLNPKGWKETTDEGTGILYDLGAHLIDQAIYLFGTPDLCYGEAFTQRNNSTIDDAFNVNMSFGKIKVNLKSSLLVKDQGPKYILHGTLGSFTKYGLDVQEDHLVSGMLPTDRGFGIESVEFNGKLKTNYSGLELDASIATERGNWYRLFDNLSDAIQQKAPLLVKAEEILQQISIIEQIKYSE